MGLAVVQSKVAEVAGAEAVLEPIRKKEAQSPGGKGSLGFH